MTSKQKRTVGVEAIIMALWDLVEIRNGLNCLSPH